jgi:site-specific recombinase XerD
MAKVPNSFRNDAFKAPRRAKHYNMNIRFRGRSKRTDTEHVTLYVRVTIDGHRAPERSTNMKVARDEWEPKEQKITVKSLQSQLLNTRLTAIRTSFDDAYLELQRKGETITARKLIRMVFEPKAARPTIQSVYDQYVEEKRITSGISVQTYYNYSKYFNIISEYFENSRQKNALLEDITEKTLLSMFQWLKDRYAQDYAVKNAQFFRTLYTFAFSKGLVDHNPLHLVRLEKTGHYDTTHLTQDQVKQLAGFDFVEVPLPVDSIRVLAEERDAFVFCCFTGLHHADYHRAQFEVVNYNGRTWLKGYRVKSQGGRKDKPYSMPLHPLALAVIEKYGDIKSLPKRNNAKRNVLIKMIAAYVGLDVHLSTKIARKTFAHYCLNVLRMRLETVAAMLGHKSTHFVKHYTEIDNLSIDSEMQFDLPKGSKK